MDSGSLLPDAPLGECFWHPGVPFTMGFALCDASSMVRGGAMHHGTDYACTGGAHFDGAHIRCTSSAHSTADADALPAS